MKRTFPHPERRIETTTDSQRGRADTDEGLVGEIGVCNRWEGKREKGRSVKSRGRAELLKSRRFRRDENARSGTTESALFFCSSFRAQGDCWMSCYAHFVHRNGGRKQLLVELAQPLRPLNAILPHPFPLRHPPSSSPKPIMPHQPPNQRDPVENRRKRRKKTSTYTP